MTHAPPHTEDLRLLATWRGGDAAAGKRLLERHFDWLWAALSARVRPRERADMTREVFACLLHGEEPPSPSPELPVRQSLWLIALELLDARAQSCAQDRRPGLWSSTCEFAAVAATQTPSLVDNRGVDA